ncbi:glycoside hydrolase family 65 protein [Weissella confusa]|uniref:Glycoside hydrolase family 65 protein n=1 Tax=Weissella confusa TaxID=1583 RepID=A0AAE2VA02_WEICO|nr:glycoside hydrolase family 65 protein [Weissella confusa]MBJ7616401.1 glycoside hydrolase family 65 protein [Weissella confusa]MBJ7626325.1 glycoside hydrolase family 65 protein [Weissella confusa]MBJ7632858.1 glycoside hydrolase family 65 protein [Weissella confusa]MBJ7645738.1 glycoside hydrolase family 65 protein [Weissella confusa]MBJ7670008.1 glycoside hydrolase family 65 protein [Weissella confusa]
MKRIFEVSPWTITTHELNPADKRLQESITSLGNEYMGMRGMFEETYTGDSLQGVYIGGVWFPDKTRVGWWKNGYPEYFGKAINALNFVKAEIRIDGDLIDLAKTPFDDFELSLDMKAGILHRSFIVKGVKISVDRFISVAKKELADLRWTFVSVDKATHQLELTSLIDADVMNEDSNYDEKFWDVLDKEADEESAFIMTRTIANPFGVPQFTVAARQRFVSDLPAVGSVNDDKQVGNVFAGIVTETPVQIEKRVIVTTSRDYDTNDAVKAATDDLFADIASNTYNDLVIDHTTGWAKRWEKADVQIEGDEEAQQGIRFNLFHLFATYYGNDARLNIGPKGFTGEKYGGATYWDTEAFAIPVYLGVTDPAVVKSLLKYRYQQIEGAYHNAKQQGLAGALYPMVTFDGIESHNEWEITFEEIHRNSTIAYAIYNYTHLTGDRSWLENEGSEVLIGIARFWADRVHYSARNDAYMIHGVTGPNEYENNINNNYYTNWMAKWVLSYALENIDAVAPEFQTKLNVTAEERKHWQEIVDKMYLPEADVTDVNGVPRHVFVAHDTFLDKELVPVRDLDPKNLPINQHWSWDRILRSPYIKQSDTLHAMYYFPDAFTEQQKRDNYEFYEPFTVHESSLSPSVHSIIAADLKMADKSVEFYERTARLDLDNYNNDTSDGLHITSMTGAWLSIVQGFAGMRVRDDQLHFEPFLPDKWQGYSFRFLFRGRLLSVAVDQNGSHVELLSGEPLTIDLAGEKLTLEA